MNKNKCQRLNGGVWHEANDWMPHYCSPDYYMAEYDGIIAAAGATLRNG